MSVHDVAGGGSKLGRRIEHVCEHRPTANGMQHLGQGGLHPRALAGGKDDNVQIGRAHLFTVTSRRERPEAASARSILSS